MAGDALHVWWEYTDATATHAGRAASAMRAATQLRAALPTFVLAAYPDRSSEVEDRLAARAAAAAAYRAQRRVGPGG